jgi:heme exporter protein B
MTAALRQIALLCEKDLRVEARTRQTLGLVMVLGLLIIVVLGLGLGPQQLKTGAAATSILWVAYLFGGVLCFEKTMAVERHDGALAALCLAPVDRSVIYFAKLLTNLVLMALMAMAVTPAAIIFFHFDLSAAPGRFAAIMAISMIGFAAVGTLFSAAVSSTRLQGGLLALVIFPICLPLVMTSTQLMLRLFSAQSSEVGLGSVAILVAFDAMYLIVSWLVFEMVLEP